MIERTFDEESSRRRIRDGALVSYAGIAVNIFVGLLLTPFIIRGLGESDYGLFVLATSVIRLLMTDVGLGVATARHVARAHSEGDDDKATALLGVSFRLYLAIDAVLLAVVAAVGLSLPVVYPGLTPEETARFSTVFAISAIYSLFAFPFLPLNGVLTAFERFAPLKGAELAQRVLTAFLTVLAVLLGLGIYALVIAQVVGGIVGIAAKLSTVGHLLPLRAAFVSWDRSMARDVLGTTLWSGVAAVAQMMVFAAAPSVLAAVSNSQQIAVFGLAASLEGYVFLLANALNGLFLPRVTRLAVMGAPSDRLTALTARVARLQLMVVGAIVIPFVFFGREFVLLWVGPGFSLAYFCAVVVILPSLFYVPLHVGNSAVLAHDLVRPQSFVYLAMGAVSLSLSFWWGGTYGALGACAAIATAYLVRNTGLHVIYSRLLRMRLRTVYRSAYLGLLGPALLASGGAALIAATFPSGGWVALGLRIAAFLVVYSLLTFFLGMRSEERRLVFEVLGRQRSRPANSERQEGERGHAF